MIYIVLGMHKSGTTLIAEILHHSGIRMVDDTDTELGYDTGNKYERSSTKQLNHDILGSEGTHSLEVPQPRQLSSTPDQRARMQQLVRQLDAPQTDWGFKDPRTCITYPLWASVLPPHRLIVVYRSPQEVWQHYRKSSTRRRFSLTMNPLEGWCAYNELILGYLKQTAMPFVVLNYELFMTTQPEFDRLRQFIGRRLDDRRKMDLYRSKPSASVAAKALWLMNRLQTGDKPERLARQIETHRH